MWGLYWLVAVGMSLLSVKGEKKTWCQLALPFLFFLLHISYGIGNPNAANILVPIIPKTKHSGTK